MKLLIADDELLTREGLSSSIDWKNLGIDQIFQADDGLRALHIAKLHEPDIILSDIRMPRMNGIELVERLTELLPDTSIIFMSGYSDKEYLKAAIKLKAIDYVEKPLNPEEVRATVVEAINRRQQVLRSRQNEDLLSMETESNLALLLTKPYRDHCGEIEALLRELSLRLSPESGFVTYIVKLRTEEPISVLIKGIRENLKGFLKNFHMNSVYIRMHAVHHVFHVFGEGGVPSAAVLSSIDFFFKEQFRPFGLFVMSRGDTVNGIARAYHSYASAVVAIQNSFFFHAGTLLTSEDTGGGYTFAAEGPAGLENDTGSFAEALEAKDQNRCQSFLDGLHQKYYKNYGMLPNQIKDAYYRLFNALNDCRQKWKLSADSAGTDSSESIIEYLENCFTYEELHHTLEERTRLMFQRLELSVPEDNVIFLIKEYIAKHYGSDLLSIKEISDYVHLSASYVCTYFKNQTGQTLNQYLTEYRMEKAMRLLEDARNQIADISAKVGYSNGNYFSKSFKKFTGLTPSKYREKMLG